MKRPSAIHRYKLAARKIRRDRAKGIVPLPAHLASGAPAILRNGASGEWSIWSAPRPGPPFVPAKLLAGPFDSRDDAQAWIDEQ